MDLVSTGNLEIISTFAIKSSRRDRMIISCECEYCSYHGVFDLETV